VVVVGPAAAPDRMWHAHRRQPGRFHAGIVRRHRVTGGEMYPSAGCNKANERIPGEEK